MELWRLGDECWTEHVTNDEVLQHQETIYR